VSYCCTSPCCLEMDDVPTIVTGLQPRAKICYTAFLRDYEMGWFYSLFCIFSIKGGDVG
jgi:hypothetical protein